MTDDARPLHPLAQSLANGLVAEFPGRITLARDDIGTWLAFEDTTSEITFAEVEGNELSIDPFLGNVVLTEQRPYVVRISPAWVGATSDQLVVDLRDVADSAHFDEVLGFLRAAREHWELGDTPAVEAPTAEAPAVKASAHEAAEPRTIEPPAAPQPPAHVERTHDPDLGSITEFVAAPADPVGAREVLDALSTNAAADQVRAQILDVIAIEGPVEVGRLIRIVGRRFGLNTVRSSRFDEMFRLVPGSQLRTGPLGSFAWPVGVDPDEWTGFRIPGPDGSRTIEEVSPEELANAMRAVLAEYDGLTDDDILRRTAEVFGISRLGVVVRTRLEQVRGSVLPDAEQTPEPVRAPTAAEPARSELPPQPAPPVQRSRNPQIDRIAAEVDGFEPDLGGRADYYCYDYEKDADLEAKLVAVVHTILKDGRYDGSRDHPVLAEHTDHLSPGDARAVISSASSLWYVTVGEHYQRTARKLAQVLADEPDFDPLPWRENINEYVEEKLDGKVPALVIQTRFALNLLVEENGMLARVEREIKADARRALEAMSPLELDVYGFTSRNAKRLQLADAYLGAVVEPRKRFVIYWMSKFEADERGLQREARFATASRALLARGETRSGVSRLLGLSGSVLDRLERENRTDVALAPDDPILTDLAPGLR